MRNRFLLACAALLLSTSAWSASFKPDLSHLDEIPMHALPLQVVAKSVAAAQAKNEPLRFAVSVPLTLGFAGGVWQQVDANTWSWRTRIYSSSAESLNFHFSQFHMPAGGSLWIYDVAGQVVAGPYTSANELGDGQLWTAMVPGETAVMEVRVPAAVRDKVQLQLAEVNHGFRSFSRAGLFGQSAGACEIDVACPQGNPWPNEIRAEGLISIGGNLACSGQLINNLRQDNTPYFLTADHCEIGQTSGTPASSVVFYWNYQNSQCGVSTASTPTPSQSGSFLIASDVATDFTLIKTAQPPNASFNLFLAGWDASASDVPSSGAVIHHPQADVKKISLYNSASRITTAPGANPPAAQICDTANPPNCRNLTAVWQVSYSQGVTETGSSGSALYNQNHQIIGQLSGGNSACNGSIGNGQSDVYARTDAAWTNNNAPASGQLKAWLDPDNTGVLTLGGINLYKPKVTIAVNPSTITLGGSAVLTWSSTSATSCSASGAWSGSQATSGSVNVTPAAAGTATYTLACTGAGGTTRNSAVMTVNGSSGGSSSSGGGGSGSGGGAFTPLTLAALLLLVFLRRTPDLLRRYSHRRLHA